MEIYYTRYESPLGSLTIFRQGDNLCHLIFGSMNVEANREEVYRRISVQLLKDPDGFGLLTDQLDLYFGGKLKNIEIGLDYRGLSEFQRKVYEIARQIPYGSVETYTWLALRLGNERLRRAVGQALKMNPFPVIVPCHRVIRKSGDLGGFRGGLRWKHSLLSLEGALSELEL